MRIDTETGVYLTGGTGFIGEHLRNVLSERDVLVTLLVRNRTDVELRGNERVQRGDITDPTTLEIEGFDAVIHLAAKTNIEVALDHPSKTWAVNAEGTANILEETRTADVERFLYASSASVYGEPRSLPIDEDHPTDPLEPYGASKLAGEALVRSYGKAYDVSTVVARIFNAFGPSQPSHNVVPTIVSQALASDTIRLGNLSPSRDFIYVYDVVQGLLSLIEEGKSGEAYNIGRGDDISVERVAEMVAELVGNEIKVTSTTDRERDENIEITRHVADTTKTKSLGWTPEYDVERGLAETVEQFR